MPYQTIHIAKSLNSPTHEPKLVKEYGFAYREQTENVLRIEKIITEMNKHQAVTMYKRNAGLST